MNKVKIIGERPSDYSGFDHANTFGEIMADTDHYLHKQAKRSLLNKRTLHLIEQWGEGGRKSVRVVYRDEKPKGNFVVKIARLWVNFRLRYGPDVETTYNEGTKRFWNHNPEYEGLLKSGEWEKLPAIDVSEFLVLD